MLHRQVKTVSWKNKNYTINLSRLGRLGNILSTPCVSQFYNVTKIRTYFHIIERKTINKIVEKNMYLFLSAI